MTDPVAAAAPGLLERLEAGPVICAEGYLFELERAGYVTAGPYVPEAVLEHPDAVIRLHRDFLRAGSDVMLAFTYYAHREKLRLIGKEDGLERMNRTAIRLARVVAQEGGAVAIFVDGDPESARQGGALGWAVVDFIVAETIGYVSEALLTPARGVAIFRDPHTREGLTPADLQLEDAGAESSGSTAARATTVGGHPRRELPRTPTVRRRRPSCREQPATATRSQNSGARRQLPRGLLRRGRMAWTAIVRRAGIGYGPRTRAWTSSRSRDHQCERGPARARSDQPRGFRLPAVINLSCLHRKAIFRDPLTREGLTPAEAAANAWRTQAPTWSGSTARAARRPCCRREPLLYGRGL